MAITVGTITGGGPVMAIFAHPDDAEFLAGGTLARWADAGRRLIYVFCTDGSKGTSDPAMDSHRLIQIRQEEQRAAARLLGCEEIVFLAYEDAMLQPTLELRRDLVREIRRYRPEIVMCFDPRVYVLDDVYLQHPDHRASGEATLAAVFPAARDHLIFPELLRDEGLEPHNVEEVYLASPLQPNMYIDISSTLDRKIQAMLLHKSQVSDPKRIDMLLRGFAERAGAEAQLSFAEPFRHVTLNPEGRLRQVFRATGGKVL
ncbi:MAG: PIG-L family deacetylase [Chloroflexi bacterium]|nr:PIG-L family deacetylase [Chloroflexota bacterium]